MKKQSNSFSKFSTKRSNAAIKEQFKQEKRKVKKEREAFFEEKKRAARGPVDNTRVAGRGPRPGSNDPKQGNQRGKKDNGPLPGGQQSFPNEATGLMPLNKFIAHSGICGRREAAEVVKKGLVKVNGELVTEPGHKVSAKDEVKVNGRKIWLAKNLVYILLNKPKDYITTTDDPQNRKTVLDIIGRATPERVYPVGRLDRNTSGVLLLTNDGELAQKLTHPSNEVKKVYAVTLNKPLEKKDFDQILKGVTLEDGLASVDVLAYADNKDKTQLGVEIHSGRNRIVRRIFESLGYDVKNLDRVVFAGLTKKNVERGKWRFLNEKEVRDLKHFRKGK
jgi:23S rRNA pseudouridine2605 synthase